MDEKGCVSMSRRFKRIAVILLALVMSIAMSNTASDLLKPVRAEETGIGVSYAMDFSGQGWSDWTEDDHTVSSTATYPTAFKAALSAKGVDVTGDLLYTVNVSGFGWTGAYRNGETAGVEGGTEPLEGVCIWLEGPAADTYDVYTSAMVQGQWLDWVVNGAEAGKVGVGTHIDGVRITLRKKGEQPDPVGYAAAPVYSGGKADPSRPMVALTFDDGPGKYENRIMDALEKVGGRATFYMVGNLVPSHASTVARMAATGCELGNHTWNHDNLSKLSSDAIRQTIQRTNDAVLAAAGAPVTSVRPPYGATGGSCKSTLGAMGYPVILWSIDTLDWKTRNADNTVSVVLNQVKDGDIILMHSIYEQSAAAAERLIPELTKRGFQLVTVSELAAARGGAAPGTSYGKFR